VVPIGTQQIQDGGRPPFWKKQLNRHISATIWPIFTKFGMVMHIGHGSGSTVEILNFLKIQDGGGRHLKKSQKLRYLHSGFTDLYEIWYVNAKWTS